MTYDDLVQSVVDRNRVVFSRWGDGEWSAILGRGTQNCDGVIYTDDLRKALRNVLRDRPTYTLGMQPLARKRFGAEIDEWLENEKLNDLRWCDAGILHHASIHNALHRLFDALNARGVVVLGPSRLLRLKLNIVKHIIVPDQGAFEDRSWVDTTLKLAAHYHNAVITVSAGPAAKPAIDELSKRMGNSILDCGSVFDPYVGVSTRRYHAAILKRLSCL